MKQLGAIIILLVVMMLPCAPRAWAQGMECEDFAEIPTNLASSGAFSTMGDERSVTLTWQDNSDDDAGFIIEASTNGTTWTQIAYTPNDYITLHSSETPATLGWYTGLAAGSTRYFRVYPAHVPEAPHCYSSSLQVVMPVAPTCASTPAVSPVPQFQAHVGVPIELEAFLNVNESCLPLRCSNDGTRTCQVNADCTGGGTCISVDYAACKIHGPSDMAVDFNTGIALWTPTSAYTLVANQVTIGWIPYNVACTVQNAVAMTGFYITVDDNTLTTPTYRDYRSDSHIVSVQGRAYQNFSSYALYSADLCASNVSCPIVLTQEAPPNSTPVTATGKLADWYIDPYEDGSRRLLSFIVQGPTNQNSAVYDPVIIDRTAFNAKWPKRLPLGSVRGALAVDIDDDGKDEIIAQSRHYMQGGPYVWNLAGDLLWQAPTTGQWAPGLVMESEVAVGDVDGDGKNEIVSVSQNKIRVFLANGTGMTGLVNNAGFRSGATLADIDGDRDLEILINTGDAKTHIYRWNGSILVEYTGWPKTMASTIFNSRPSVADINNDGHLDVVVDDNQYVYAWSTDPTHPLSGWSSSRVAIPSPMLYPVAYQVNGGANPNGFAQPSIADLDGDGTPEIVVGRNIISSTGAYLGCFRLNTLACSSTSPSAAIPGAAGMSAAIGEFDSSSPGLEVLLGGYVWSSNVSLSSSPIKILGPGGTALAVASLVDGGLDDNDQPETYALIGSMNQSQYTANITAFESDGEIEYTKSLYGNSNQGSAPQAGDFDGDGNEDVLVEITDATYGAVVALYRIGGQAPFNAANNPWPMAGHDPQRTGRYGCKQQRQTCTADSQCCSGRCKSGACQ